MGYQSRIKWLNTGTLAMAVAKEQRSTDLFDAIGQISEQNRSGRPIRYLFDLSENGIPLSPDDAIDLASFFVELTPSKTAIALVSTNPDMPTLGETLFRAALRGGGFQVCIFARLETAQVWLSQFVTDCEKRDLVCSSRCQYVLTPDCPAERHRHAG
ncbi:hypothetical protein [Maricaulis sp.]|uniref:hypothetical protein n=1 Tax=Maricaulis sp. TaxID=1486257 RepID=UPI00262C1FBB|nr:hypothetical protein [Maricaulis sp.]